jgi:hypothetical protein
VPGFSQKRVRCVSTAMLVVCKLLRMCSPKGRAPAKWNKTCPHCSPQGRKKQSLVTQRRGSHLT